MSDDSKLTPTKHKGYGTVNDQLKEFLANKPTKAILTCKDGETIEGYSFGAEKSVAGELVFNTGMVGYPESLTDPSYAGQILVLTYPLIGNYGVPNENVKDKYGLEKHFESSKIQITALIISDYSEDHSHHSAYISLSQWLKKYNIPGLYNIDTRKLTKKLRLKGSMLGKIEFNNNKISFYDPNKINLVKQVSRNKIWEYTPIIDEEKEEIIYFNDENDEINNEYPTIIAIDCGIKNNIIRYLCSKKVHLKVVPWDYDILQEKKCDGLFISNGPGDPAMIKETINNLSKFMKNTKNIPIFGVCLGNQILALASGAKTYKMKFGNRGMNQPCIDLRTSRCYITPQNHGFAVDEKSLGKDWKPFFRNANDYTNEGIIHRYKPWFSVQFHPEHNGGPTDTDFLFDMFLTRVRDRSKYDVTIVDIPTMIPYNEIIDKVLLLGSGGLSIGQAGEFDYSGSQAIKALKEENVKVILINPNIATVQTSSNMADEVYFLPVTPEYVTKVIKKEQPNGILLQFGGQTALNCGIKLMNSGILKKYNVRVLGTPISTIEATEDREIFANKLKEVNEKVAPSGCANTINDAIKIAKNIGYPVLLRAAFALGGLSSGFASNEKELIELAKKAFSNSEQVIIDKSLRGWKEVEYEVVRDINNNCITVCNMENFDPLGIHTGDSIVVAPSQTLSNSDYYMLRTAAIKIVRHLGVIGECNIQYALDPYSSDYCVIEVNARLSRSSALASKATGYPLAYVAAKLAMGRTLTSIKNSVTRVTQACFEPSLDYCVVKIPKWDLKKFDLISKKIGSAMKSVGEVMAIDRKFEAAFSKALRMVNKQCFGFGYIPIEIKKWSEKELNNELREPSDIRVYAIALAFQRGYTVDKLYELTNIDRWFLCKLRNIMVIKFLLKKETELSKIPRWLIKKSKQYGFSDIQISKLINPTSLTEYDIRDYRISLGITPFVKQIDTLAAEFPAQTNYLYITYNGNEHDLQFNEHGIIVLGCGAYRIGSSCEFDWCAVSCVRCLKSITINNNKNNGYESPKIRHSFKKNKIINKKNNKYYSSIVINYNPETVSTDYDECDRLYFEEISFERVLDIYDLEKSSGVIVSVGGQIPNNLAMPLSKYGKVKILGTQPDSIDNAENRHRFSKLLDDLKIDQPAWCEIKTVKEAKKFGKKVGYPVLIRPSYVLSGAAMNVVQNEEELDKYLKQATDVSNDHPVVISKFVEKAVEIEMDGVSIKGNLLNYAISEHVEHAGVHSGDATLILPAQNVFVQTFKRIRKVTRKICKALMITGPFNIQFLCKDNEIKVIECNLRASRSFPFVSKTFNINFIELATKAMLNPDSNLLPLNFNLFDMDYVCVKSPMFSFTRLQGADPVLKVEMASTGEVACFGDNKYESFIKSIESANYKLPIPNPNNSPDASNLRLDYIYEDINGMKLLLNNNNLNESQINLNDKESTPTSTPSKSPSASPSPENINSNSEESDSKENIWYLQLQSSKSLINDLNNLKKYNYPSNILLSIGPQKAKYGFVDYAMRLHLMGFTLYCTDNTHYFFSTHKIPSVLIYKASSSKTPNALDLIADGTINLVINCPASTIRSSNTDGYLLRRKAVDYHVPLLTNLQAGKLLVKSLAKKYLKSYEYAFDSEFCHIKSWREYVSTI